MELYLKVCKLRKVILENIDIYKIIIDQFKSPRNYILLFFCIIFCLISLVNHYNYRTYAFDLGIYNNCLYQYGHFHKNHYPYLHSMFTNFLSDHFSLYTVILSPLYYIFGTPTLLLIQIISILFGSVGVYKIVKIKSESLFLPEIAMIHYLCFFGIYSALSFDYHDNVVSAMLMPWFLYYFNTNKVKHTILFAILIVIGKENMPIWLSFVCFGLFILFFKDKSKRNLALIIAITSIIYMIIIIKLIMPAMDPMVAKNGYDAFHYSVLGTNSNEIISNLTHQPLKIFNAFFTNHLEYLPELAKIKSELYICLIYSGGILLLFKPQYLIMLIPIIAQKVLNDDFGKWGINYHYSIEFTPIIVIGFYDVLMNTKIKKIRLFLAIIGCLLTMYVTKVKIGNRFSLYYNKINTSFYIKEHYQCEFDKKEVKRVMKLIPENANLSSLSVFAPHLSFRKNIYQYPDVHDAEYVLLAASTTNSAFPLTGDKLKVKIQEFIESPNWDTISSSNGIYLFKKTK